MTKAEEIQFHNLFIKFKNENKSIDEIKALLKIDETLIDGWDSSFEIEKEALKNEWIEFSDAKVVSIDEDGVYSYKGTLFLTSQLEMVKHDLRNIISGIKDEKGESVFESNAIKYLPIFEEYFTELDIDFDKEKGLHIKYRLNTEDENIKEIAQKAVYFYMSFEKGKVRYLESFLIKNHTSDTFKNAINILPYSLKTLKVKDYDGIIETGFEGLPIDTNWIFLIGENGYGKTTLLRAITIGFIGSKDEDAELFVPDFDKGIGIEYFSINESIIHNITKNHPTSFPHLACYGPSRLQIQTDQTQNDVAKKSTTTYSLFNADGILLNIEFELLIWFLEKNPRFDAVKQTFLKLIPYLSDIQVDVPQRKVFYIEKELSENEVKYKPVTFNQLASGFRSILAMVGDMMIRLFKSQPQITDPSELAGIVIIDELDLHWHPKMQREIPTLLSSIFPKVQFIASTHSLVPLLGAPENSVLLKVNRTVEEGITVEKVEIDFQALSSDTMLRDIFDLEKYMSDAKQKAWERYTKLKGLIHFEQDETQKQTLSHEREVLGDKYNFPV